MRLPNDSNGYYATDSHRYLIYLAGLIWVWCVCFISLAFVEIKPLYALQQSVRSMYAVDTALNFILFQYLCLEVGRYFERIKRTEAIDRTLGKELIWSFVGIGLALIVQHTVVFWRVDHYAPQLIHYLEKYPLQKPNPIIASLYFISIWSVAIFFRLGYAVWLSQKILEVKSKDDDAWGNRTAIALPDQRPEPLYIQVGKKRMKTSDITHITVEGHYCRFYLYSAGKSKELFLLTSMKQVLGQLPGNSFLQIHRSHVINTSFFSGIQKRGCSHMITLVDNLACLPVSRHRIKQVQSVLEF